jgi:hypothetical protein
MVASSKTSGKEASGRLGNGYTRMYNSPALSSLQNSGLTKKINLIRLDFVHEGLTMIPVWV